MKKREDYTVREKYEYTIEHRKAFRTVEKELLGKNTIRGYFHDIEKLFLFPFLSDKTIQTFHRKRSRHHDNGKPKSEKDYIQMVIDWECARITKPDKPLNAYETMLKWYPHLKPQLIPIFKKLKLKCGEYYEV